MDIPILMYFLLFKHETCVIFRVTLASSATYVANILLQSIDVIISDVALNSPVHLNIKDFHNTHVVRGFYI